MLGLTLSSWLLIPDPLTVGVLWLVAAPAAVAALITAGRSRTAAEREWRLRAAIEADKLRFEEERHAWEEKRKAEQRRLDAIESHLIDRAASIAWSPPPLDSAPLQPEHLRRDEQIDQLIEVTTERVFEALRTGKYVRNDRFEHRLFWEDVGALVRDVAAVYQPGGDRAWLETDARQLALAVHRAALRVSLRLEQVPTAPSSRKLADIVKWTETYRSGQSLLEYAKPLMNYVPWLYRLVRVLAGANPATLGLSVILFELVKKAGFQVSVEVLERYLKSLARDFLTAVGQEAANVYGNGYGRRSKAWVLGSEAVHLAREARESRAMLAAVIRLLDELDLRDEVDRRALQRSLVAPSFQPARADWLPIEERTEVLEKIEALFEAQPSAMEPRALATWKAGLESRLGHRSRLEVEGGTVHDEAQLVSVVRSLISWGLQRGARPEPMMALLQDASVLAELTDDERGPVLQMALDESSSQTSSEAPLPRFDLTEARKKAYVDDLVRLMGALRPWGPEPDLGFLDELARRFRLDAKKLRARLAAQYVVVLSEHFTAGSPLKKLPPGGSFAALFHLEPEERWDFAEEGKRFLLPSEASKEDRKAASDIQRELRRGAGMWLLASEKRAVLLRKPDVQTLSTASSQIIWEGRFSDRTVRVEHSKAWGWTTATVHGGQWHLPPSDRTLPALSLELSRTAGQRIEQALDSAEDDTRR